ncbi:MAG TPA: hypothetical protein VMH89_01615, partial [Candidatus Acidoferrum sp.]|nr:hypothetical protein [Candidatus Acidoferrum sp.]
TEASLNLDVNGDGTKDLVTVLFWDPAHSDALTGKAAASLVVPPGPTSPPTPPTTTSVQALEITALAVAPNGGRRLLQYVVAPLIVSAAPSLPSTLYTNWPYFPAALTLDGNFVTFQSPGVSSYQISGLDSNYPWPSPSGAAAAISSIGYINAGDTADIQAEVNPDAQYYPGANVQTAPTIQAAMPSLCNLTSGIPTQSCLNAAPTNILLRQSWMNPASLDSVMQDITNSADVVIPGSASSSDIHTLAPLMTATNPMTIVVNGNLRLNGRGFVGYGLLLVTGTLTYDPDASWNGVVLVVGQGIFASSGSGSGGINGAVLVAQTRDSFTNDLITGNTLGAGCFGTQSGCNVLGGHHHHGFGSGYGSNPGFGIIYNSGSVKSASGPLTYKVLSFHEIPLPE